jgi:hypothetical protein
MVNKNSTRGTRDSDNLFFRLPDRAVPRSYQLPDNGGTPLSKNPCQKAVISYPRACYMNTDRPSGHVSYEMGGLASDERSVGLPRELQL